MRYLTALLIALSLSGPAAAHDWYPIECCHSIDCAPVEKTEMVPGVAYATVLGILAYSAPPVMVVTTKIGTAIVPPDLTRRESKDNRMHACIRQGRVTCIFMPPSM